MKRIIDRLVSNRRTVSMPKIIDKEKKRIRIIESAARLFAKRGYTATRMLNIAEAAGIGKGTIYEYFKSKDELFIEAFNAYIEEINKSIEKNIRHIHDPVMKLRRYFFALLEILQTDFIEFAAIILDIWAEGLRRTNDIGFFSLDRMYRNYRMGLIQILDEGVRQGKFKPINTTITASIIVGTLDGLMVQWIVDRNLYHLKEAIQQFSEIIIDGLINKK